MVSILFIYQPNHRNYVHSFFLLWQSVLSNIQLSLCSTRNITVNQERRVNKGLSVEKDLC